jgi:hypothetical protein
VEVPIVEPLDTLVRVCEVVLDPVPVIVDDADDPVAVIDEVLCVTE